MTKFYLSWLEGRYGALISSTSEAEGAVEIDEQEALSIRSALSAGAGIVRRDDGWEAVYPPKPVPDLSFAQLLIGLVSEGWITQEEGDAWLSGTLPQPVLALINSLPQEDQFAARARATRPSVVRRGDPLVSLLVMSQGKSTEELDDFFRLYSGGL